MTETTKKNLIVSKSIIILCALLMIVDRRQRTEQGSKSKKERKKNIKLKYYSMRCICVRLLGTLLIFLDQPKSRFGMAVANMHFYHKAMRRCDALSEERRHRSITWQSNT